jgi:hypothetical protein
VGAGGEPGEDPDHRLVAPLLWLEAFSGLNEAARFSCLHSTDRHRLNEPGVAVIDLSGCPNGFRSLFFSAF